MLSYGSLSDSLICAAYKSATREQKLALEISAAKRERNYTLSKFAQACVLNSIKERLKKV